MKISQNYYKARITSPFRLHLLNHRGFLHIGLSMAKIFSTIPPFLCKSSRVRKKVPLFDGHLFHDHASDLILLCFYRFISIQIKAWFFIFEFRSIEVKLSGNHFLCGTNFPERTFRNRAIHFRHMAGQCNNNPLSCDLMLATWGVI